MVEHALSKKLSLEREKIQCQFSRIIINDSTFFQLPEDCCRGYKGSGGFASKAGIKNQYCYDLLSQEIINITVQEASIPDSNYPLQDLRKNDLRIEDLGYFKVDKFLQIEQADAYFLNRLRFRVTIYEVKKENYVRVDLLKVISKMKVGQIKSIPIFLGDNNKFATRLVLEKLPKQLSDEKRRKLKRYTKEKRRSVTKERLIFCDVNAFVTNCNEEQLPNYLIRQCYSLRWQVEIIFKAWKSYFKIDQVKQMKMERFECFHYGCLMLIIISTHLLRYCRQLLFKNHQEEISELKFFKLIASMKQDIKEVITKNRKTISNFLDQLIAIAERTCVKEEKLNRLQPLKIIMNLA